MANQGKRAWKLQENVAHGSQVTCLALGPSSGRVMVTGGEDRKVNMWAIGKPNVIMSLSGHTTPIESVYFNNSEELVLAGSQSGTLKIWDLEAAKIVRTLTGHKSGIKCVDFHPYGEFVASGSSDTNLKLWDVRRKGCIFTYKGHTNTVNHLRFSPDGRWIISAGEDGVAKLWDLTAGKILNDFNKHTASVNRIEFHPKEFLLATCSSDRTVKFWDLETFDMVSSTEAEQSAIRTISFHPEGHCLFSGSQDSLRVYGWEPMVCYESYSLSWGKVSDLSFSTNQLIGASFAQTNVSVWVIDLAHLDGVIAKHEEESQLVSKHVGKAEVKGVASDTISQQNLPRKHSPQRKSFNTRPRTTSTKPRAAMKEEDQAADAGGQNAEPQKYEKVFKPASALSRSPISERRNPEPFKAPIEQAKERDAGAAEVIKDSAITRTAVEQCQSIKTEAKTDADPKPTHVAPHIAPKTQSQYAVEEPVHDVAASVNPVVSTKPTKASNVREMPSNGKERKSENISNPVNIPGPQPSEKALNVPLEDVAGVIVSDFLPVVTDIAENQSKALNIQRIEDDAALKALRKSHESICTIMNMRLKNLSVVGQMWTDGEIKTAVQTATSMPDQAILVDLLNVLILKQTLWNLDICVVVLPQVKLMLSSKYESYLETGCSVIRLILKSFAPVIKSNMAAPPVSVGCDIVREERYQKCKRCHSYLLDIKSHANKLAQVPGKHGALNRQIALALSVID